MFIVGKTYPRNPIHPRNPIRIIKAPMLLDSLRMPGLKDILLKPIPKKSSQR